MNYSSDSNSQIAGRGENVDFILPVWSEDDFEEIQAEAPWDVFSSEIDNWAAINIHAVDQ